MKSKVPAILLFIIFLYSCEKKEDIILIPVETNSIYYQELNHIIPDHSMDTLDVLSFYYIEINSEEEICRLNYITDIVGGGAGICSDALSSITIFNEGDNISRENFRQVQFPPVYDLNKIKGVGDCFIGISSSGCSPEPSTVYGWMRINLNNGGDTLRIIDMARNSQIGLPIKAGQFE